MEIKPLEERMKLEPREFIRQLGENEKALLFERSHYASWDAMVNDIKGRGVKPYIYRIFTNVQADLPVIEQLRRYETDRNVNLLSFEQDLVDAGVLIA